MKLKSLITAVLIFLSTAVYAETYYPYAHAILIGYDNNSKIWFYLKNNNYDGYMSKEWNKQTVVFEKNMTDRNKGAVLSNALSKEFNCIVIYIYSRNHDQLSIYAYNKGAQLMRYEACEYKDYEHEYCSPIIAGLDTLLQTMGKQDKFKEIKNTLLFKEYFVSTILHRNFVTAMELTPFSTWRGYDYFKTNWEKLKNTELSGIAELK